MRVIPSVSKYLMGVVCLILMGTYVAAQEPPKPDAIKTALDAAKARQSLDKAKAKQDAAKERPAAPKDEADFVKRSIDSAKAKQRREGVTPPSHSVETLPMPKRVLTWDVSCEAEAGPCSECGTACKCVACVCESVTPAVTSHPPVQPWTGGAIPQGWEWVGTVGNGVWRKAVNVQPSSIPLQFSPPSCVNGQCGAVGSPVTFAASPCASGNCPNVQPTTRRR